MNTNDLAYSVSNTGDIFIHQLSGGKWSRVSDISELGLLFMLQYVGFKRLSIEDMEEQVQIPDRFISCIMYYVRAKVQLDEGSPEMHNYYMSLFNQELRSKSVSPEKLVFKPSGYSLL